MAEHARGRVRPLIALVTGAVLAIFSVPPALAVVSASPTAATSTCGSTLLAGSKWLGGDGVPVKSNGQYQGEGTSCGTTLNSVDGITTGYEWQCVELVDRLYVTRGWINSYWPGNGGDSVPGQTDSMYDEAPAYLSKQADGSISYVGPGDVVSVNEFVDGVQQDDGHVFIVNTTGPVTSGSVRLISQNDGTASAPIVKSTGTLSSGSLTVSSQDGLTYQVIGVVHAPGGMPAEAPLPANAASNPAAELSAATCLQSRSSCVAAGTYTDSADEQAAFLETGSWNKWTPGDATLPASTYAAIQAIACASATSCTAAGYYTDPAGDDQGLLVAGSGTSWTAAEAPLPANAATDPEAQLPAVACTSSSSCIAAGDYTDSSGNIWALLVTGSGTSWTAAAAPLPANAASSSQDARLYAIACPSKTSCVAVGTYTDSSGDTQGLLVSMSRTKWTPTEAPVPANGFGPQLSAVTCPIATSCVAVGNYRTPYNYNEPLILTGSGTSWTATQAPLPSDFVADNGAGLTGVACPSASSCTAAGSYPNGETSFAGVLETGSGTSWTDTEAPLPASPATSYYAYLDSVACTSGSVCAAIGTYACNSGCLNDPMLVTGTGTAWIATEAPLPANAYGELAGVTAVACSTTTCVTVGTYQAGESGPYQGLLVTGAP